MNIKDNLKKNSFIVYTYKKIRNVNMSILTRISPEYASRYIYKRKFKKNLDLKNPKTFNEKLMWIKLYWQNPLKSVCADKYEVRKYIEQKGKGKYLNTIYDVFESPNDIEWDKLPKSFVLKVNNTCGANIICSDKDELDEKEVLLKLEKWMKDNYYTVAAEIHYKNIKPKIICEKYLKPINGFLPIDYKVYCFNGIPKVVMICTERETGNAKYHFCDLDGNILPFDKTAIECVSNGITKIELPETIKEMCEVSESLSKPFPFVRMDFYDHNGTVVFGEMTFTPCACLDDSLSEEGEMIMGNWIMLPDKFEE